MTEVSLMRVYALLKALGNQMENQEYILTGEPSGARAAWSNTYNRLLLFLGKRFSGDPLFSLFQELPEDPSYGVLVTAVRQLEAYLRQRIHEAGGEQGSAADTVLERVADLAREMGQMGKPLGDAEVGAKAEDLQKRLADLQAEMGRLEDHVSRLLKEEE